MMMRRTWIWFLGACSVLLPACGQVEVTVDGGTADVDAGGMVDVDAGGEVDRDGGGSDDDVAPETMWLETPGTLSAATSVAFAFAASEPGSELWCSLDGAEPAPCTSPHEVSVDDGVHTFAVYAVDPAGNRDLTPAEHMWQVDATAPDTMFVTTPPAVDNSVDVSFALASTEEDVTFECALDQGDFAACTSPYQAGPLADGEHSFQVRARDAAGNLDPSPAAHAWIVDLSIPDTIIVSGPAGPVSSPAAMFSFDSPTGVAFECERDGGGFQPCTSPLGYDELAEGCYELHVRAFNQAGAVDPTPAVRAWCVDLTPPVTSPLSGPAAFSNTTVAHFAFEASEAGATFICGLDDGDGVACSSPFILNDLAEGAHALAVEALDPAGNRELEPAVYAWTVDITRPETTITSAPPAVAASRDARIEAVAGEEGASFECAQDGGDFEPCTMPWERTGLAEGSHRLEIRAVDRAGNRDATPVVHAWSVDTVAPDTSLLSGPSGAVASTTASFAFEASEEGSAFVCGLDGGELAPCSAPVSLPGLGQGTHTFRVQAIDAAGNADGTPASRTWTVDTVAPDTAVADGPEGCVPSTSASFELLSDEPGATFQCRRDGQSFAACTSPKGYTGLSQGQHSFEVRARDAAGNMDGSAASRTWTVDTTVPDTTLSSGPSGTVSSTTATFGFGSNESNVSFECKLDSGSYAACTSTKRYTGLGQGQHTFRVRARDCAGNVDGSPVSRTWTVDTVGPTVTITDGPPRFSSRLSATFSFTANESGATFQCRVNGGSFAACTSPKHYGLPTVILGPNTFQVRAIDSVGNIGAAAIYAWDVDIELPPCPYDPLGVGTTAICP